MDAREKAVVFAMGMLLGLLVRGRLRSQTIVPGRAPAMIAGDWSVLYY
jgi:hypothetical protein